MALVSKADIEKLDLEARLQLMEQIWNSIVDDPKLAEQLPLDDATRDVLAERIKEDDDDPDAAIPWDEARKQLYPTR